MCKAGGQNRSERNSQVLNNAKSGFRLCDKFREPRQRNRNQSRKNMAVDYAMDANFSSLTVRRSTNIFNRCG
jgi:hypothetical protein